MVDRIGEDFIKPYSEASRAKQSRAQAGLTGERMDEMPDELLLRQFNALARAHEAANRTKLSGQRNENMRENQNARLGLMRNANTMRAKLLQAQIALLQAKTAAVQNPESGGNGRNQPAILKKLEAAKAILAKYPGSIDANGNIDLSKLSPFDRIQYNDLMQSAGAGDAYTRKKLVNGSFVEATLKMVDPNVLARYQGAEGRGRLISDIAKDKQGQSVPELHEYYPRRAGEY